MDSVPSPSSVFLYRLKIICYTYVLESAFNQCSLPLNKASKHVSYLYTSKYIWIWRKDEKNRHHRLLVLGKWDWREQTVREIMALNTFLYCFPYGTWMMYMYIYKHVYKFFRHSQVLDCTEQGSPYGRGTKAMYTASLGSVAT